MRPKTEKLLEENMGGNLLHISLGNHFFGYDTKSAAGIKRKRKTNGTISTKKKPSLQRKQSTKGKGNL